jgi:hypothetical protein
LNQSQKIARRARVFSIVFLSIFFAACGSSKSAQGDRAYIAPALGTSFQEMALGSASIEIANVPDAPRTHFADLSTGAHFTFKNKSEAEGIESCSVPAYALPISSDEGSISNKTFVLNPQHSGCYMVFDATGEKATVVAVYRPLPRAAAKIQSQLSVNSSLSIQAIVKNVAAEMKINLKVGPHNVGENSYQIIDDKGGSIFVERPSKDEENLEKLVDQYKASFPENVKTVPAPQAASAGQQLTALRRDGKMTPNYFPNPPTTVIDALSRTKFEAYWGWSPAQTNSMRFLSWALNPYGRPEQLSGSGVNAADLPLVYDYPTDPFYPMFLS